MLNVLNLWSGNPTSKAKSSSELFAKQKSEVVLTATPCEEEWDPLREICQNCEEGDSSSSMLRPTTFKEWFAGSRAPMTEAWKA